LTTEHSPDPHPLLRARDRGALRVTFVELFFDVVYVFAITQLSHLLLDHLTVRGALQTLLLLLAVWWAWVYTAWFTNWYDPDHRTVRLVLLALMFASLVMSSALPEAFGAHGLVFASAYVAMQVGRTAYASLAQRDDDRLRANLLRVTAWAVVAGVPWIAGGIVHGSARTTLWVVAVAVDYFAPLCGFRTPRLGRSTTADWTIAGEHLAERCQLFLMVAFGESILVTGATFGDLTFTAVRTTALVVAFLGAVALWWVYFDRSAVWASEVIAASDDPGRLGRSAYTYIHLLMVAGIIVTAVADELVLAHPTAQGTAASAAVALGGPALFLAGHGLFKYAVAGAVSVPRLVALAALGVCVPIAAATPRLFGASAAAAIVAVVAATDVRAGSGGRMAGRALRFRRLPG
jgi:low temperature requirement protein LtrA